MSNHERRITPRKSYTIPVRFNVVPEQYAMVGVASVATVPAHANAKILTTIPLPQQGEIVNLSERGIAFKTRQNLNVGETVEIFFTLPTALTARAPEDVRCSARVVRVEKDRDGSGMVAIGAAIDRFERTSVSRNWDN
jgi:PilZ domain-containing protein